VKALVILAHPDDYIVGCDDFLAKYFDIISFNLRFIAEGTSCRFKIDKISLDKAKQNISIPNDCAKETPKNSQD
jgi:hypothetical protein